MFANKRSTMFANKRRRNGSVAAVGTLGRLNGMIARQCPAVATRHQFSDAPNGLLDAFERRSHFAGDATRGGSSGRDPVSGLPDLSRESSHLPGDHRELAPDLAGASRFDRPAE